MPIDITATPARHGPPGSFPIVGEVVGFALRWKDQEHGELWISGDTVLYDGVRDVARRLDVGTALMHLGGVRFPFSGPLRYTMNAEEAIELCDLLNPQTMIPVHYEGWTHFRQDQDSAKRILDSSTVASRVRWLEHGIPTEITV
jgi:L-ascorbate metabolism protein UlaG (beta-lactamase superfamily)